MYTLMVDTERNGEYSIHGEYQSVDEAVKEATQATYSAPFLIVEITKWEAKKIN